VLNAANEVAVAVSSASTVDSRRSAELWNKGCGASVVDWQAPGWMLSCPADAWARNPHETSFFFNHERP